MNTFDIINLKIIFFLVTEIAKLVTATWIISESQFFYCEAYLVSVRATTKREFLS